MFDITDVEYKKKDLLHKDGTPTALLVSLMLEVRLEQAHVANVKDLAAEVNLPVDMFTGLDLPEYRSMVTANKFAQAVASYVGIVKSRNYTQDRIDAFREVLGKTAEYVGIDTSRLDDDIAQVSALYDVCAVVARGFIETEDFLEYYRELED